MYTTYTQQHSTQTQNLTKKRRTLRRRRTQPNQPIVLAAQSSFLSSSLHFVECACVQSVCASLCVCVCLKSVRLRTGKVRGYEYEKLLQLRIVCVCTQGYSVSVCARYSEEFLSVCDLHSRIHTHPLKSAVSCPTQSHNTANTNKPTHPP